MQRLQFRDIWNSSVHGGFFLMFDAFLHPVAGPGPAVAAAAAGAGVASFPELKRPSKNIKILLVKRSLSFQASVRATV